MKILIVHNSYQEPGGEDAVVEQESDLLRAAGHKVVLYRRSNAEIHSLNLWKKVTLPLQPIWSSRSYSELRDLILREEPDIAHFHNTHFMISPAGYHACRKLRVPVVQTIHNYRLVCPAAQLFRDGRLCEDCLHKTVAWPGVLHGCYRGSRGQTAVVAASLAFHHWSKTWADYVDKYILLTPFARDKLIQGGLPASRIVVKPNFIFPDPGESNTNPQCEDYLLYTGRLAPEKGIQTLLSAWHRLKHSGRPVPRLKVVGDGPLGAKVAGAAGTGSGIEWMGWKSKEEVLELMKGAMALIVPSLWYEAFPLVLVEAFAVGLPVIASDVGSVGALVEPERTGLHFRTGDPDDLATKVTWLVTHPGERRVMGHRARVEFEDKYTAERNYDMLMEIYGSVLERGRLIARG